MILAPGEIERAAEILRAGGLVAFPTETVYGLGADATSERAVRRIFAAKGRPADHPVIVHLASADALPDWARTVPDAARELARVFWPGPMTLILERARGVLDVVTGGQSTVGLRVPSHPVARALLQAFGRGVAAPSANRFGHVSPTLAEHVAVDLGDAVDAIIDGGPTEVGIESTIIDLSRGRPVLLRPGRISAAEIGALLGEPVAHADADAPRASGTLAAHYAPRTPLRLVPGAHLATTAAELACTGEVAVLAYSVSPPAGLRAHWYRLPDAPDEYARSLYAMLRQADRISARVILVEAPPAGAQWDAIADRLRRAAHVE